LSPARRPHYKLRHETVVATGNWKLVIEATMFVTYAVANVWTGIKSGGYDLTSTYTRISGCDPTATLTVEVL
jgi:hypothetical protein